MGTDVATSGVGVLFRLPASVPVALLAAAVACWITRAANHEAVFAVESAVVRCVESAKSVNGH